MAEFKINVSAPLLCDMLHLPDRTKIVDTKYAPAMKIVNFVFDSDEFNCVPGTTIVINAREIDTVSLYDYYFTDENGKIVYSTED
jgi:hypothetical protein